MTEKQTRQGIDSVREIRAKKLKGGIADCHMILSDLDNTLPPGMERELRRQEVYGQILAMTELLRVIDTYKPTDSDVH